MQFQKICRPSRNSELVDCISVARVQPRTSKGITDLLLPQTSSSFSPEVSLRSLPQNEFRVAI